MKVQLILGDYAQTADGKLTVVGAAWSFASSPVSMGLGVVVETPWFETNNKKAFKLELLDSDGQPVLGPDGAPVRTQAQFEVGRPTGHPEGVPIRSTLPPVNVAGLPMQPGRYEWVVTVDGRTEDYWRASFNVREQEAA